MSQSRRKPEQTVKAVLKRKKPEVEHEEHSNGSKLQSQRQSQSPARKKAKNEENVAEAVTEAKLSDSVDSVKADEAVEAVDTSAKSKKKPKKRYNPDLDQQVLRILHKLYPDLGVKKSVKKILAQMLKLLANDLVDFADGIRRVRGIATLKTEHMLGACKALIPPRMFKVDVEPMLQKVLLAEKPEVREQRKSVSIVRLKRVKPVKLKTAKTSKSKKPDKPQQVV